MLHCIRALFVHIVVFYARVFTHVYMHTKSLKDHFPDVPCHYFMNYSLSNVMTMGKKKVSLHQNTSFCHKRAKYYRECHEMILVASMTFTQFGLLEDVYLFLC